MADLITLEELQSYMTRSGAAAPSDTTLLKALITRTSEAVAGYLQRDLLSAARTQVSSGRGGYTMPFDQWPATAVTLVLVNGQSIPPAPDDLQPGYVFDELALYLRGYTFARGVMNVRLVYTAGYAEVPQDVKQAVCELVALRFKERDWIGVSSKTLAGETVSYTQTEMRGSAKKPLDRYRRVAR